MALPFSPLLQVNVLSARIGDFQLNVAFKPLTAALTSTAIGRASSTGILVNDKGNDFSSLSP